MENTERVQVAINPNLQQYLATIGEQSINEKLEGYFSVDVVIDAFTKGEEMGREKALQSFREAFVRKSTQVFLYGVNLGEGLEKKGYKISGFYINPFSFKVIIATDVENTYSEDFVRDFYALSYDYQERFKRDFDSSMDMMFIRDRGVDEKALEIDGFVKVNNGKA